MLKKRGLGKGLEALIPDIIPIQINDEHQGDQILNININEIFPNENQPRKAFSQESLMELAQSIKNHGLIQPIVVQKQEAGYMIIAGERRWRAARKIELKEMPCIVRDYAHQKQVEIALIENLQREDLNIFEEAESYKYLIDKYNITQEKLGEALGKSRPYIANTLRLLHLDNRVIEMIKDGRLTSGHGRAILGIEDHEKQYEIALKVQKENLTVRQVEQMVSSMLEGKKKKTKKHNIKDVLILDVEESLRKVFGTKVNIIKGQKKGRIEIEYYNEGDLERIIDLINRNK